MRLSENGMLEEHWGTEYKIKVMKEEMELYIG